MKFKEDEVKINHTPLQLKKSKRDSLTLPARNNFESLDTKSNDNKSNSRVANSRRKLSSSPSMKEEKIEEIKSDNEIKDKSRVGERIDEESNVRFSKIE